VIICTKERAEGTRTNAIMAFAKCPHPRYFRQDCTSQAKIFQLH
jgi:hypothetical protein